MTNQQSDIGIEVFNLEDEELGIKEKAIAASPDLVKSLEPVLQSPIKIPIKTPPPGVRHAMELNVLVLQTALHWMIRHSLSSKYKVPGKRQLRESTEDIGLWFKHVRRLCMETYQLRGDFGLGNSYKNSTEWFNHIILEFFTSGLQQILYSLYPVESFAQFKKDKGTSRREVRILNEICNRANNYERPVERSQHSAFSQLLLSAMEFAEKRDCDVFRNESYKPFIKTWRTMNTAIDKHFVGHMLEEGGQKLICYPDRSRRKTNLTYAYTKFLNSGSPSR